MLCEIERLRTRCYIPSGIVLFFFVDNWSGYEVGRLRTAIVAFYKRIFRRAGAGLLELIDFKFIKLFIFCDL